jgi:hypothetical protein
MNPKRWLCSLLLAAISVAPVFAGTSDGAESKNNPSANGASSSNAAEPVAAASPTPSPSPSPNLSPSAARPPINNNITVLLNVLVMKGVLAPSEANAIRIAAPEAEFQLLVEALSRKGLLSAADMAEVAKPAPHPAAAVAAPVPYAAPSSEAYPTPLEASVSTAEPEASLVTQSGSQAAPGPQAPMKPAPPAVIAAVAPVRVFPVDPPKPGSLSGIKVGPLTLAPYGFIKATFIHDSSDPDGDDFPFPGLWLNAGSLTNTGPTQDPEVHVKARSTRFGLNVEWPDISPKLSLTGKIEGDFEGNFSEVDNRDVTSIRSNMPQLRLAFVRLDYRASESTDIFFVGGQDWTLFGSGALPNILETTFLGAFWGDTWGRSPQLRGGLVETLNKDHNVNLEAQVGIMMPSSGQILKLGSLGLAGQLGQGEREGADSDRPEWEGRVAVSFQLDNAKGVAPAQIALAGFRGSRTSIAFNSSSAYTALCQTTNYCATFPNGFQASSTMYGGQLTLQLPTRWATLVGSAYRGGDMRFLLGGQLNSFATDVGGLTGLQGPFPTLDGGPLLAAGGAVLGCSGTYAVIAGIGTCSGTVEVAPQRSIRSFGGFLNLGLPLSRWFNANPKGHNAGWQLYLDIGKDQVVNRDLNNPGYVAAYNGNGTSPLPMLMGKMAAATIYYKLNPWCQFGFEQSIYATRMLDHLNIYTIAGVPSNEWQDHRTEFGPIFTF